MAPATSAEPAAADALPPGNHPLEVAARRGIGPLSPLGHGIWHGEAKPCVTCGQLVPRAATVCDYCEQDLTESMLEKMRAYAGPWFVLEHVRPFPGVSLERIIRQIRRGAINETSIVRGPSTDFQWRFAVETPGLCRYFGRCWKCFERITPPDAQCSRCGAHLSFEAPRSSPPLGTSVANVTPTPPGPVAPPPASAAIAPALGARPAPTSAAAGAAPASAGGPTASARAVAATVLTPATSAANLSDSAVIESEELQRLSAAVGETEQAPHEDIWDAPPELFGIRATWILLALLGLVVLILLLFTGARG
jgi:hypothetical protein